MSKWSLGLIEDHFAVMDGDRCVAICEKKEDAHSIIVNQQKDLEVSALVNTVLEFTKKTVCVCGGKRVCSRCVVEEALKPFLP